MATCVVSIVRGVDGPACAVHVHPAPCPHNGEPADPAPLHNLEPGAGRRAILSVWWRHTQGQRGIVLHTGPSRDGVSREHDNADDGACWCNPEVIAAELEPIPRPQPAAV